MNQASEALEIRRRERAFEQFEREWWWFDESNHEHVHQFSAAWEILRRTRAFNELHEKMLRWRVRIEKTETGSFAGVVEKGKLMSSLHDMIPCCPPAPAELCEMLRAWQNMLANGWTPNKTYLEARNNSEVQCVLPDEKKVFIPPTYGGRNHGVPLILPRQVSSQGHTSLVVALCEVSAHLGETKIVHLAGSTGPHQTIEFLRKHGKVITLDSGRFIVIQFPLHHPPAALKALLITWLDLLQEEQEWKPPPAAPDVYSRGASTLLAAANALEAMAFFPADQPRNVIERGFKTLIRPERLAKQMPVLRAQWTEWDFAERMKYAAPGSAQSELQKQAEAAWDNAENYGRPVPPSTTRPIRPGEDLANLACADCAPFYRQKRTELPNALPFKKDADFNKRLATGLKLVSSQDDIFLPLLKCSSAP